MHTAPRRFIIHYVELFVKKSLKVYLAEPQALMQIFKHLSRHIFNRIFALFIQSKKLSHFIFRFVFWIEIHICLLLKLFPGFVLIFPPRGFLLVLEECWFFFFDYFFLLSHFLIKFGLSYSFFCHLLLKQV
jgi:hypothetical protein